MRVRLHMNSRITKVSKCLAPLAMKCWAFSGPAVFTLLLFYWVYGGILAFSLLCFAITGVLYHKQDSLLYHPDDSFQSRIFVPTPSIVGLPYENIYLKSEDGTVIHVYFIKQEGNNFTNALTIIYFHGNAGNIGHRLRNASQLYHQLKCNLLMVEYRGYGLSQGSPSEEGLYMDARAATDYLFSRQDINHKKIVVFGRSLGGAVAVDLVARPEYGSKIWCLLLENTFTSIPEMAYSLFRWHVLKSVPNMFYKNQYMSNWKVKSILVPTYFISGLSDNLVPSAMMTELHSKCASQHKQIIQIVGGTHNDTWTCPGYYGNIMKFLKSVEQYQPNPSITFSCIKDV
uniref:Protein ABHD13 n=1 Tax=Clastoptera arizonana TaxID=38151 RepID=A0A1B6BZ41_9HEMI